MQNKKLGIFLILVLLAIAGGIYFVKQRSKPAGVIVNSQDTASDKGLVDGFPKELVIGVGQFQANYRKNYTSGQDQYTTEFVSSYSAVPQAFDAYHKLLSENKYTIIGQSKNADNASLYGRSSDGSSDLSVVINSKGGVVSMTVTYLKNNTK